MLEIPRISNKIYSLGNFSTEISFSTHRPSSGRFTEKDMLSVSNWKSGKILSVDSTMSCGLSLTHFDFDNKDKTIRVFIPQNKYLQFFNLLMVAEKWVTSKEFEDLYAHDVHGRVTGLTKVSIYIPSITLSHGVTVTAAPSIIRDYDGVQYEGIVLKAPMGDLTLMTCHEFLHFATLLKSYLLNSHVNDMSHLNTLLLFNILQKMNDKSST